MLDHILNPQILRKYFACRIRFSFKVRYSPNIKFYGLEHSLRLYLSGICMDHCWPASFTTERFGVELFRRTYYEDKGMIVCYNFVIAYSLKVMRSVVSQEIYQTNFVTVFVVDRLYWGMPSSWCYYGAGSWTVTYRIQAHVGWHTCIAYLRGGCFNYLHYLLAICKTTGRRWISTTPL
jgi:hypothetical protein